VSAGSLLAAAAATGGWAAVVSFSPVLIMVLLGWFGSTTVSGGAAVRFALAGWLLGHGVPVSAGHGPVSLVPLTLTALVVWRLARAGAHTARAVAAGPRDVPYVVAAVALTYGAIGGLAALAATVPGFSASPVRALLVTGVVAGLAGAPGAAVESGAAANLWRRLPELVREGLRGGLAAALAVLAAGAALAGTATAIGYLDAVRLYRDYEAGATGGVGILLVGLLYTPNLVVWGASYLVGPGFAVGVGTEVTVFDVSLGPLPAVPVLAGLPTGPAPHAVGLLLVVPVLAGMVVGVLIERRHPGVPWGPLLGGAAVTGAASGLLLGGLSFAAAGSLGAVRLAQVGPTWWLVGLVACGLIAGGSLVAASAARLTRPDALIPRRGGGRPGDAGSGGVAGSTSEPRVRVMRPPAEPPVEHRPPRSSRPIDSSEE
jgi:hypothetical protein